MAVRLIHAALADFIDPQFRVQGIPGAVSWDRLDHCAVERLEDQSGNYRS